MLKTLCTLNGTSGREDAVRDYILTQLPETVTYKTDALGNLLVEKTGKARSKNKVALFAHMDEVGFIITYITDDGFLKFAPVGGVDARAVFGKAVTVGARAIPGVVGGKAVHQLTKDEKDSVPEIENMLIDIGATTKTEAESLVSLGDIAYFRSEYVEFGDDFVKAKAIDDRAGVQILLDMLRADLPYDMTFCFTVQEEIGTRGATAATFTVRPDYALVVESTTAADLPEVSGHKQVCKVGGGAVVSFMDRGTVYDKALYDFARALAVEKQIPCQTKTMIAGGNDAAAVHKTAGGVKTLAISVPCRYIHSGACVANKKDMESVADLTKALAEALCNAENH
ncbi:MAG: M42 family metallopeptidase [Candidatus Fimenecus sp.]